MTGALAVAWSEWREDRRHPLHLVLLLVAPLVPIAVHRYVVDLVGVVDAARVGSDWFAYGVVGLSVLVAMDGTLRAGAAALQRLQERGALPGLLAAPVSWSSLPVALAAWPGLVHLVAAGAALGLGVALGADLSLPGVPALVATMLVACLATAGLVSASAAVALLARRGEPVARLFTLATTLLSGAVFPIDVLPAGLRVVSLALPHTHAIRLARHAVMSTSPTTDPTVGASLAWLLVTTAVTVIGGWTLLALALRVARREARLVTT